MPRHRWFSSDETVLARLYAEREDWMLANVFGCSEREIRRKAHSLGLAKCVVVPTPAPTAADTLVLQEAEPADCQAEQADERSNGIAWIALVMHNPPQIDLPARRLLDEDDSEEGSSDPTDRQLEPATTTADASELPAGITGITRHRLKG